MLRIIIILSILSAALIGMSCSASAAERPQVWAVVIGIDDYQDETIRDCRSAESDSREIQRWLIRDGGWPADHILRMDPTSQKTHGAANATITSLYPTRENLIWAVHDWLLARVRRDDLVLIYFAGQAVGLKPEARARPGTPGRDYLLPIDAKRDRIEATGWDLVEAINDLAAKGENPILLWLDTSLNGRGNPVVPETAADPNAARWLSALSRWPGVSAWVAAEKGPSLEAQATEKHGPFVTSLLNALGTKQEPRNLLGSLDRLNRDPALQAQGFRTSGGLSPDLTLWKQAIEAIALAPAEILLQQGHSQYVSHVVVSADGAHVISSSGDATIRAWRLEDRTLTRVLPNHFVEISALAQSSDGSFLASGDEAGGLSVWHLPDFRPLVAQTGRPHSGGVSRIAFLSDGRHLASLDGGGEVLLWEIAGVELRSRSIVKRASALACGDGLIAVAGSEGGRQPWLRIFRSDGSLVRELTEPAGLIPSKCLAMNGRFLAYGDRSGRVAVFDISSWKEIHSQRFSPPIEGLALSESSVAVGLADTLHVVPVQQPDLARKLALPGAVDQLSWSADGRWLGATSRDGRLLCWERVAPGVWNSVAIQSDASLPTRATSLAFGPGGRFVVAGCRDGDIRQWDLPSGQQRPEIAAHRGQVSSLSVSAEGRYLLQVTKDRKAQIWDLQEGRSLRVLEGNWRNGVFLQDGLHVLMTDADGDVRLVARDTGAIKKVLFERPLAEDGKKPTTWGFSGVACSADGRFVGAVSEDGPLACVWKIAGGAPVRVVHSHTDFITSILFSDKGNLVLTSSLDGTAIAWDTAGGDRPKWVLTTKTDVEPDGNPISSTLLGPGVPKWLVTGHRNGRVIRWELGPQGASKPRRLGQLEGEVHALAISKDGRWLSAGGDDKSVWTWSLSDVNLTPRRLEPRHDERVNALAAFPNSKVFASGSDDTTIKLWDVSGRSLLGTLAALPNSSDWVAFTPDPDGSFDSSPGAEREVTWIRDGRVLPLDQFFERYRVFRLTDRLRQGERPPAAIALRSSNRPPNLAIDRPAPRAENRQLELSVSLEQANVADLRLYHNGVPVRDDDDFVRPDPNDLRRRLVRVNLRKGMNTFYAMATRGDRSSIDGRSNRVEIQYDGPDAAARLFVVAVGVSDYKNRPLKYADHDAKAIASYLRGQGVAEEISAENVFVLTNAQVTDDSVRKAFLKIRQDARPEDSMVLFLAGHTDVRRDRYGRNRFSLLLPSFPFSAGGETLLTARGASGERVVEDDPKTVLSYASLYQQLIRVPALQRLVVIDACQAGAAVEDTAVKRMQQRVAEQVDNEAQRARTSYILASRKDEPAFEVESLKHGLLTHLLLHGMGAPGLAPDPAPLPANADRDHNQVVTTEELRRYVDEGLPLLAEKVIEVARRAGPAERKNAAGAETSTKRFPVQSTEERGFPLVRLPMAR
jgi:WD40 repeat protein/uncharacterized caspase-like protein